MPTPPPPPAWADAQLSRTGRSPCPVGRAGKEKIRRKSIVSAGGTHLAFVRSCTCGVVATRARSGSTVQPADGRVLSGQPACCCLQPGPAEMQPAQAGTQWQAGTHNHPTTARTSSSSSSTFSSTFSAAAAPPPPAAGAEADTAPPAGTEASFSTPAATTWRHHVWAGKGRRRYVYVCVRAASDASRAAQTLRTRLCGAPCQT